MTSLPCVWYVGTPDVDVDRWRRHVEVRTASTLAEVPAWRPDAQRDRLSIVVELGSPDQFAGFVEQLTQLRATVGPRARIAVRDLRYRLREYTQKRRLLRAGVDAVLSPSHSLQDVIALLLRPRVEPVVEIADVDGKFIQPWVLEAQQGDATGWLSRAAFVDEVERRVRRERVFNVPRALVEVEVDELLASDVRIAAKASLPTGRTGDLSTATRGARFFFLQGCRGRDALSVAIRCMGDALAHRAQCFHIYTGEPAIGDRLLRLRQEAGAENLLANVSQGKSAVNGAAPAAANRVDAPHSQVSIASAAALLVALAWPFADASAQVDGKQPSHASAATVAIASLAYERGDYSEAARLGLSELQREPGNHELRFVVANSLAWSGQYREALQQYGLLADTPHARAASIGSANVYVWSGRPHLADPLFRRVLSVEPDNVDAQQGLASAQRQLRPRSTVRGESLDDSTRAERSSVMLAHRWRDAGLTQIFEVAGERIDESRSPAGPDLRPRKASFGYQNLGLPLTPKLVLSADSGVRSALYGNLALHGADDAVSVDIGRVNWGEVAFDPSARRAGLAAARAGAAGRVDTSIGGFSASAVHFAVTDGNRVAEANAQYAPAWQPFVTASGLRAFVGVYGRKAQRHDPRYWSPASGYYIGQVGLSLNQSTADWDFSAEARRSQRIGGEGAQGWTAGLAGTRWLNRDWAVRFEGLYIETRRDSSAYRSKSIALSVDHVW
ncbi:MAG: BcsE family c-di-GMP-binding protein [Burkholderiaceae bacterium]